MLELELVIKELREELNMAIIEKDKSKEQAKTEKEELQEVGFFYLLDRIVNSPDWSSYIAFNVIMRIW